MKHSHPYLLDSTPSLREFIAAYENSLVRDVRFLLTVGKMRSPRKGAFVTVDLVYRNMGRPMALFGESQINLLCVGLPWNKSVISHYHDHIFFGREADDFVKALDLMSHPDARILRNRSWIIRDFIHLAPQGIQDVSSFVSSHLQEHPCGVFTQSSPESNQFNDFVSKLLDQSEEDPGNNPATTMHPSWSLYLNPPTIHS